MIKKNLSYPASLLYRLLNGYDKYMRWIDRKPTKSQQLENEKVITHFVKNNEITEVVENTIKYVLLENYQQNDIYNILQLRYKEKKTLQELSDAYGISIEAVRKREMKGIQILNKELVRQLLIPLIWNDPRSYLVDDDWIQIYSNNSKPYSVVYQKMLEYKLDYVLNTILDVESEEEFLRKCQAYEDRYYQHYDRWVKH